MMIPDFKATDNLLYFFKRSLVSCMGNSFWVHGNKIHISRETRDLYTVGHSRFSSMRYDR